MPLHGAAAQYDKRLFWREGAEGECMGGVLYYDAGTKPAIGTGVIIIVDAVNKPTGMWDGELIHVTMGDSELVRDDQSLPDARWARCIAKIADSKAPKDYQGCEPHVNYHVYIATSGIQYLRGRLAQANTEIRGLKVRMGIERGVWHAALKAMVCPDAFGQFKRILDEFLERLGS